MTDENPLETALVNLQAANVALDTATTALRDTDSLGERDRRRIVGWLDDIQATLGRCGNTYQRLNERSQSRPSIAVPGAMLPEENDGAPSIFVHEEGEGPKPQ